MSRFLILLILLLTLATSATSQDKKDSKKKNAPPKVLYSVPLAAKPGEKQKLVLRGTGLAAVKDVKVSGVGDAKVLGAKAVGVPNNYPAALVGDSEVEIELELPKDIKPGAVKLTAVGTAGESNAYSLLVRDALSPISEKEPNDGLNQAQKVAVRTAIEGTIKNERDVDVFQFEGKKGDRLRFEVQAARFGSPLDPLMVLYDASRAIIDSADDTDGSPDPIITVTLPRDGIYYISVIDAHDRGGPNFGYRLLIRPEK